MKITLYKKRLLPCPTLAGWICLFILAASPVVWWVTCGESFFSLTERQPAQALVVEGWIGIDGVQAAKAEFERGGYHYIVTSGGLTNNRWGSEHWNYATEATKLLVGLGVPASQVIEAAAPDAENHRTFESAIVVRQVLGKHGLHPECVNVFSFGTHARRSRLVFAKALSSQVKVGVISWTPPGFEQGPWWKSSERSLDLMKETVGYLFELLLNSGRRSNLPVKMAH